MTIPLRDAGPGDRPAVVAFMARLQDHESTIHSSRPPGAEVAADHVAYLERECRDNDGRIVIAVDPEDRPIALAIFLVEDFGGHFLYPDHQRVGWVSDLWIEPDHRGGTVLDSLLEEAERHFKSLGLTRMMLSFLTENEGARKAYRRRGFQPYEEILEREIR